MTSDDYVTMMRDNCVNSAELEHNLKCLTLTGYKQSRDLSELRRVAAAAGQTANDIARLIEDKIITPQRGAILMRLVRTHGVNIRARMYKVELMNARKAKQARERRKTAKLAIELVETGELQRIRNELDRLRNESSMRAQEDKLLKLTQKDIAIKTVSHEIKEATEDKETLEQQGTDLLSIMNRHQEQAHQEEIKINQNASIKAIDSGQSSGKPENWL